MPFNTDEEDLLFGISYALKSCRYGKPRGNDRTLNDQEYARVAEHILSHLLKSWEIRHKPVPHVSGNGWLIEPGRPPVRGCEDC